MQCGKISPLTKIHRVRRGRIFRAPRAGVGNRSRVIPVPPGRRGGGSMAEREGTGCVRLKSVEFIQVVRVANSESRTRGLGFKSCPARQLHQAVKCDRSQPLFLFQRSVCGTSAPPPPHAFSALHPGRALEGCTGGKMRSPATAGAGRRRMGDNVAMNEEHPTPEQPVEAPRADAQPSENPPPRPQSQDPHRRLRELLAIAERDRSDAVWDEIIGLEIQLAPGNRAVSPQAGAARRPEPGRHQQSARRPDSLPSQQRGPDARSSRHFSTNRSKQRGPASKG